MNNLMEQIGRLCTGLFLLAIRIIVAAWVLTCLWRWYIVGIFALESLSVAQAVGVMAIAMCLRGVRRLDAEENKAGYSETGKAFAWSVGHSMFILLIGRVAKHFL